MQNREVFIAQSRNELVEINQNQNNLSIFDGEIIENPIEQYKLRLGSHCSSRTIDSRMKVCANIWNCNNTDDIVWNKITKAHILGIIKTLTHQEKKIATIRTTLSCLKGVIKEAYDLDLITNDNYSRIMSVRAPRGSVEDCGRAIDITEINLLFEFLSNFETPIGIRDNAILKTLIGTGLRRAEITNIKIEDINFNSKLILIKGKGNKQRTVGINDTVYEAIKTWMTECRGDEEGYLFNRIRKCGTIIVDNKLTPQTIYNIAKLRFLEIGITDISTHDLRKTFATYMLQNDVDLINVMKMLGHSSPMTTKKYDKSGHDKAMSIMKDVSY